MDPNNSSTTIVNSSDDIKSVNMNSNAMSQDYLVTQRVDTSNIPKSQMERDLEAIMKAEEKITSNTPDLIKKNRVNKLNSLPSKLPTINDILSIKNPFRGE